MKKQLSLLIIILMISCDTKKEEELAKASVIQVMTTPIYASSGHNNSEFLVSDYL